MSPSLLPASAGVISWGLNGLFLFLVFSLICLIPYFSIFLSQGCMYYLSLLLQQKKNPLSAWALYWSQTKISCSHFPLCCHSSVWSSWDGRWQSLSGEHLCCSAPCDFVVFNTLLQHVTSVTQLRSSGTFGIFSICISSCLQISENLIFVYIHYMLRYCALTWLQKSHPVRDVTTHSRMWG